MKIMQKIKVHGRACQHCDMVAPPPPPPQFYIIIIRYFILSPNWAVSVALENIISSSIVLFKLKEHLKKSGRSSSFFSN